MNNKIKSLIYLSCFIFASVVYNLSIENESNKEVVLNTLNEEADMVISSYIEEDSEIEAK